MGRAFHLSRGFETSVKAERQGEEELGPTNCFSHRIQGRCWADGRLSPEGLGACSSEGGCPTCSSKPATWLAMVRCAEGKFLLMSPRNRRGIYGARLSSLGIRILRSDFKMNQRPLGCKLTLFIQYLTLFIPKYFYVNDT